MYRCKACGAEIVWVTTPTGKSMPCDPALHYFQASKSGSEVFVMPNGSVVKGIACDSSRATRTGYTPHWATCRKASSFKLTRRTAETRDEAMQLTMDVEGV